MIKEVHIDVKKLADFSVAIWVVAQIACIFLYWGNPPLSDAKYYQELAIESYNAEKWYPLETHMNSANYIFNPGYVNFLIVQLYVFGSFAYNGVVGLALNAVLLLSLRLIIGSIVNDNAKQWATVLFCLMPSNWLSIIPTLSELFFMSLFCLGMVLIQKRYLYLILSALLLSYANYTRPIVVLFSITILLYMLYHQFGWKRIGTYLCSYVVFTAFLTLMVTHNTASKIKSGGTTLGYNLAMAANDHMNGTYNKTVFMPGNYGYVKSPMNVYQKDDYWRQGAFNWIKNNIGKYLSYVPVKFFKLWWADHYFYGFINEKQSLENATSKIDLVVKLSRAIAFSIVYYIVVFFFIIALRRLGYAVWGYWGIFLVPVVLGTVMHLVLYGTLRYHYPYMPILIMYAAMVLSTPSRKSLFRLI